MVASAVLVAHGCCELMLIATVSATPIEKVFGVPRLADGQSWKDCSLFGDGLHRLACDMVAIREGQTGHLLMSWRRGDLGLLHVSALAYRSTLLICFFVFYL